MSTFWLGLLAVAILIVVILAVIAYRAVTQLRLQQRQQEQRVSEISLNALAGVRVLASSYLAGQVEASEASLRIAVLLNQPGHSEDIINAGREFTDMAAQLAHIPTHQAWKNLPGAERRKLRVEMDQLETRHQNNLRRSAESLCKLLS